MFEIKTAQEIIASELDFQIARRRVRQSPLVQAVYRCFLASGGPVAVDEIVAAGAGLSPVQVERELTALDAEDVLHVADGRVDTAYPFTARPSPFVVRMDDGRERHVCCAIDALGMAAMLGRPVELRAPCHHCGHSLAFPVGLDGAGPEAADVMVWVGPRCEGRALTGL